MSSILIPRIVVVLLQLLLHIGGRQQLPDVRHYSHL